MRGRCRNVSSAEEICAQQVYNQLAKHDLAYYEKRIKELKDPCDRWRMRVLLDRVRRELLLCSFVDDPNVVKEEPDK